MDEYNNFFNGDDHQPKESVPCYTESPKTPQEEAIKNILNAASQRTLMEQLFRYQKPTEPHSSSQNLQGMIAKIEQLETEQQNLYRYLETLFGVHQKMFNWIQNSFTVIQHFLYEEIKLDPSAPCYHSFLYCLAKWLQDNKDYMEQEFTDLFQENGSEWQKGE